MNYYAATAVLARVCLYAQREEEAYQYAKEVIDYNTKTNYFTMKYSYEEDEDVKLWRDILFGVEALDVLEYINTYNNMTNPDSWYWTYLITNDLNEIFAGEEDDDIRYQKWQNSSTGTTRFSKYEKYDVDNSDAKVNNYLIPLVLSLIHI